MKQNVKLVIIDFSGVLFNDLKVSHVAISKVLRHYKKPPDTLRQFTWRFKLPYYEYLKEKKLSERVARGDKIKKMFVKIYGGLSHKVRPFPEVKSALHSISNQKTMLAVVSQTPGNLIRRMLAEHEIDGYFDCVLGLGDYERPKPEPESINIALKRLNVRPHDAIYVGDMKEDITAARRADVLPIAVSRRGSYHPIAHLKKENPAFIIKNLNGLSGIVQ